MRNIVLSSLLLISTVAASSSALAQDSSTWAGPYVGVSANTTKYMETWSSDENFSANQSYDSPSKNTTDLAVFFGSNSVKNNVVYGYEIDLSTAGETSSFQPGDTVAGSPKLFAHFRSRFGYVVAGDFMPYVGLGIAITDIDHKISNGSSSFTESNIVLGLSAALGVEYALSQEVKIRGEYQADRFSSASVQGSTTAWDSFNAKLKTDTFKLGVAYSF